MEGGWVADEKQEGKKSFFRRGQQRRLLKGGGVGRVDWRLDGCPGGLEAINAEK